LARRLAQLASSTFSQLGQYDNSPGHRDYCYAKLATTTDVILLELEIVV